VRKTTVLGACLLLVQIPLIALTFLQADTWGGPDTDEATGVAFGADGSVYVAGATATADGDRDAFVRKYGPDRQLLWQQNYGLPANATTGFDDEFVSGVAVGPDPVAPGSDAIYVAGQLGTGVLFVAKFDPLGNLVWDRTYGDNGTIATGAALDASGNVYVSGLSSVVDPGNQTEALLLKFTALGTLEWARAWGGAGFDASRGVAVGPDGVYLAGETNSFFANDAFLVKFDVDGNLLWERDWGVDGLQAPFTGLTAAYAVAADALGGVYITGNAFDTGHRNNIVLVKFSGGGDLEWSRIGGPGFGAGRGVALTPDGEAVFVSGNLLSEDPDFFGGRAFVAEFTAAGKPKKANTWAGDPNDSASADAVAVDASGLVVTAGIAGPAPHEFGKASNSGKTPDAHLVVPLDSHVTILPTALGSVVGQLLPVDPSVGGGTDAFALWMQR
jgi:hypothetical protein